MAGFVSYGTTVTLAAAAINDIKSIQFSGIERGIIVRTPLDATHARKLAGRPDSGEITLELYWNESSHTSALMATLSATYSSTTAPSTAALVCTFPDGTVATCNVYVKKGLDIKADGEDALIATVVFAVDGAITLT